MPKQDELSKDVVQLGSVTANLEKRVRKLEKEVTELRAKLTESALQTTEEPVSVSTANPVKRRLGWALIIAVILLYLSSRVLRPMFMYGGFGVFSLILNPVVMLLLLGIAIYLIATNPSRYQKSTEEEETPQETRTVRLKEASSNKSVARTSRQKDRDEQAHQQEAADKTSFEQSIGKNWLPKIGIASLVLGIAYFVVYVIQNRWIGPTGQIALGILAGIALVIVGEMFYRKTYQNYGMTISGGGFALIYFSLFAGNRIYPLIPFYADIAALSIIIICAIIFAVRYSSLLFAAGAFLLGYIVPILFASVNTFFLIYALLLTIAVTYLTATQRWTILGVCSMGAMYLTHTFWLMGYNGSHKHLLHIIFLFIYVLLFSIMSYAIKDRSKKSLDEIVPSFGIIAVTLLITYLFLIFLSVSMGTLSLFYFIVPLLLLSTLTFYFVYRFSWQVMTLGNIIATYIVYCTWMAQHFTKDSILTHFWSLLLFFAVFHLISLFNMESKTRVTQVFSLLLNAGFFYGLNLTAILVFDTGYEGLLSGALAIVYLLLSYFTYNKSNAYFNTFLILCFTFLTLMVPLQFNQSWITISWAVLTFALVWLSFKLEENTVRISSSILGILTFGKLLFYDSHQLHAFDVNSLASSTRLISFAFGIVVFYIIAGYYHQNKSKFDDYETYIRYVTGGYVLCATILLTTILFLEINDLAQTSKNLWISLALVFQAILTLVVGFFRNVKFIRILGLILFGLAILKVFIYDLSSLQSVYRIISFIALGLILLVGAFLYNKFKQYL